MFRDPAFAFLLSFSLFAAAEAVLHWFRSRKFAQACDLLRRAKEEAEAVALLPLNNPHPLVQATPAGDILFANTAAMEKFEALWEDRTAHPVLRGLDGAGAGGREAFSREIACGGRIYSQTVAPAQTGGRETFIVYCHDITDLKRHERALREANRTAEEARAAAEKANRARGDFLANMSHELRTPMNGIIGLSEILVESGLRGRDREAAQAISNAARSLLTVLNDVLDFSKIEAGELSLETVPFDPRALVRQVMDLHGPVAARKGLAMKGAIGDSVPPLLSGDPSRLLQILNNLVGNALKFTEKGSVTVFLDGKSGGAGRFLMTISVADTGIGIPEDKREKVFLKFQQSDTSTARKYGGTGLGLAIARDLAALMGGTLSMKSAEGKGTVFTLAVPAGIPEAAGRDGGGEEGGAAPGFDTKAGILVVDDHPVNLLFMRRILERLGFERFDEASGGAEAIELLKRNGYGLILLDCQMPDMDGFETARRIRRMDITGRRPAIVAVTADAMKGAEKKCAEAGMDDYISKPIDRGRLLAVFRRWIPAEAGYAAGREGPAPESAERGAAAGGEGPAVFDRGRLLDFAAGDADFERKAVQIFTENLDADIAVLEKSFRDGDGDRWESAAHKLYGGCAHFGAFALAEACEKAEAAGAAAGAAEMKACHEAILAEYRRLSPVLRGKKAA